ncbi:ribosomal protein L7/L12 [Clostridium tarantellae]|uniref:50S ribosomal protein L7/L12 n=1 Tax=Clostridium tarantellae TaxID=39493 RepID=A0A6I1MQR3_9CLOT|nr:ribosomal protein L7/L12 [Clostridium tarantellae]MPQ44507.1 50S ribosomal protein L7/L12 [Clostridium tarantellae]
MNYLINNPLILVAIILAVIGSILWLVSSISMIKNDIKGINIKLNRILKETEITKDLTDELKNLISQGKKVEAIKKYRNTTGIGLKEAKDFIDSLDNKN